MNHNTRSYNTVLFTVTLSLGIHLSMLQSVLERMSAGLGLSLSDTGLLVSMNFFGVLAGPLIAGETGDRLGRKGLLAAAMALYAVSIALAALAPSFAVLAPAILAAGVAFGTMESSVTGLIADGNPSRGAVMLQYVQAFFSVGAVAGPLLTLLVIASPLGWRGMLGLMALLFTLLPLPLRRLQAPPRPAQAAQGKPGAASLSLLRQGFFLLLCLSMFLYVGLETATASWMDIYFVETMAQPVMGKVALSLFWGGTLAGRLLAGRFSGRADRLLLGGLGLSVLSLAAVPFFTTVAANIALFALTGLGFSTAWPAIMNRVTEKYTAHRGAAIGLVMATSGVGGMAFPYIMGLIADSRGMTAGVWTLPAANALLLALCVAVVAEGRRRKQPDWR